MKLFETKLYLPKNGVVQITDWVLSCVAESGVQNGVAILNAPHTTSGIFAGPDMLNIEDFQDVQDGFNKIIPPRVTYTHQFDNTTDAAGHNKCAIMDTNMALIIENGKVVKGSTQGLFFIEFDGPRTQKCWLAVYED